MLTVIIKNWQTSKSTDLLIISLITKNWKTCSNKILWGIGWNCEDFNKDSLPNLQRPSHAWTVQKSSAKLLRRNQLPRFGKSTQWKVTCATELFKLMLMNSLFTYKHAITAMLWGLINCSLMPTFIGSQRSFSLLHQNLWTLAIGRKKADVAVHGKAHSPDSYMQAPAWTCQCTLWELQL